jgi:transcriptional regulator with XRE-family HTH domain
MARGISARELSRRSGVNFSSIRRIERGQFAHPRAETLNALAVALEIEPSDLLSAAGYVEANALPSFSPYLRSKYGELPDDARAELERSFERIVRTYGYQASGPAPGEDEE